MVPGSLAFLQDCRILILFGQFGAWIAKRKKKMEKIGQIPETHPALERVEGVKKYCGDKSMGYHLLEVVLTSLRGGEEAPPSEN